MPVTRMKRFRMQKKHLDAVKLMFEGHSIPETAELLFDIRGLDGGIDYDKKRNAERQVHYWAKRPEFLEAFRELQQVHMMPRYSKAMQVFDRQLDDKNPWVAQGAAREVVNQLKGQLMGEQTQTINVQVQGMPELGVPGEEIADESRDEGRQE